MIFVHYVHKYCIYTSLIFGTTGYIFGIVGSVDIHEKRTHYYTIPLCTFIGICIGPFVLPIYLLDQCRKYIKWNSGDSL